MNLFELIRSRITAPARSFLIKGDGVEHWTADCPRELIVAA